MLGSVVAIAAIAAIGSIVHRCHPVFGAMHAVVRMVHDRRRRGWRRSGHVPGRAAEHGRRGDSLEGNRQQDQPQDQGAQEGFHAAILARCLIDTTAGHLEP